MLFWTKQTLLRMLFCTVLLFASSCSSTLVISDKVDSKTPHKGAGMPYFLPKTVFLVNLEVKEEGENINLNFQVHQKSIPDPKQMYLLEYTPDFFSDDEVDVEFTKDGFLQSILAPKLEIDFDRMDKKVELEPVKEIENLILVPGTIVQLSSKAFEKEEKKQGWKDRLAQDSITLRGKHSHMFSPENPRQTLTLGTEKTKGNFKLMFNVTKVNGEKKKEFDSNVHDPGRGDEDPDEEIFNEGVKFRISEAYQVEFKLVYDDPVEEDIVLSNLTTVSLMPDQSPVFTLPIERYFFVKEQFSALFVNGTLSKAKIKKSSFFRELTSVPKAIFDKIFETLEEALSTTVDGITGKGAAAVGLAG